jgi:hypothetical protein
MFAPLYSPSATKVVDQMVPVFAQLPHLPKGIINFLATIAPYLSLLGAILGIVSAFSFLSAAMNPGVVSSVVAELTNINPAYYIISAVLTLASSVIMIGAFNLLRRRDYKGWLHMFWSDIIGVIQMIVGIILAGGSPISAAISIVIMFYILFEMRTAYTNKVAAE